jgi:hypothetical protein
MLLHHTGTIGGCMNITEHRNIVEMKLTEHENKS